MNRDEIIVTVLKPQGEYAIYNVPLGYLTQIKGDGTVVLLDKGDEPEPGEDIAADLRNYECSCGSLRCRSCIAAEEIERLREQVANLQQVRNTWQRTANDLAEDLLGTERHLELFSKAAEAFEMGLIADGRRLMQRAKEAAS